MVRLDRESNWRSSISTVLNRGVGAPLALIDSMDATARNSSRSSQSGLGIGQGSQTCPRSPCRDGPGSLSRSPAHRRDRSSRHKRKGPRRIPPRSGPSPAYACRRGIRPEEAGSIRSRSSPVRSNSSRGAACPRISADPTRRARRNVAVGDREPKETSLT